jgi:tRNA (guanine-N7-)-methyltransferase
VTSALYKPADILTPLRWDELFGRSGPVEVEIGCGKGTFLAWAAKARPTSNFLGIDRLLLRLRKADRKLLRLGVTNVRLLRLEASYVVAKLIPTGSVAAYHIYFPDPWPKRRHAAKRLFRPSFVCQLRRTLKPDGEVHFATDSADYLAEVRQVMTARRDFTEAPAAELPEEARTDFEREFLAAGKHIHRCRFSSSRAGVPSMFPAHGAAAI